MTHLRFAVVLSCVLLTFLNLALDVSFIRDIRTVLARRDRPPSFYSFVDGDVPERMPLMNARPEVLLSVEESVRFTVSNPEAYDEWLWTSTLYDAGHVHLGPTGRLFSVALTHELHCLRSLRRLLDAEHTPAGSLKAHAEHCLSMLRQQFLCAADTTLEPGSVMNRNFTLERFVGERRCADVAAFYDTMLWHWEDFESSRSVGR